MNGAFRRVAGFLIALALAAIGLLAVLSDSRWTPPEAVPIDPGLLAAVPRPAPVPDADARASALDRPLFMVDRRPLPVGAATSTSVEKPLEPPTEADPFEGVRLLGLIGEGDQALAILRVGAATVRLSSGASLGGWTLDSASERAAEFVSEQGRRTLTLQRDGSNRFSAPESRTEPPRP